MLSATETFVSQTHPDVSFTMRRVGIAYRQKVEIELADNGLEQRLLRAEISYIEGRSDRENLELDKIKEIIKLEQKLGALVVEERLHWLKSILQSVSINGEQADKNEFLEYIPDDLFDEMNAELNRALGLSPKQAGNSQQPTTLPQVEDGLTTTTSADSAASDSSTENETVAATSRS